MPIVDGKYKNPGWVNNGPPYINASELNDMGNTLENLDNGKDGGSGLSNDAKAALLALLEKVAYVDADGQTYLDALETALYPPANLVSISAVFNQGDNVIYDTDSLDTLKQYLTVTANMSDGTTQTVSNYTLSGTLTVGTSTITVSYSGKSTTFDADVTQRDVVEYLHGVGLGFGKLDKTSYVTVKNSGASNRMCRISTFGDNPLGKQESSDSLDPPVYPVKVPANANSLTITLPSGIFVATNFVKWNGETYKLATDAADGWNDGGKTYDISSVNDGNLFYGCVFKNSRDSAAINDEDTSLWTFEFA